MNVLITIILFIIIVIIGIKIGIDNTLQELVNQKIINYEEFNKRYSLKYFIQILKNIINVK